MNKVKISIPTPCNVSRETMSETQNGWFCDVCSKEVLDFRTKTDAQIAAAFESESPCGVFLESQLDKTISVPEPKVHNCWRAASILKAASLAMAGVIGLESCFMGKRVEPSQETSHIKTEINALPSPISSKVKEELKARAEAELEAAICRRKEGEKNSQIDSGVIHGKVVRMASDDGVVERKKK